MKPLLALIFPLLALIIAALSCQAPDSIPDTGPSTVAAMSFSFSEPEPGDTFSISESVTDEAMSDICPSGCAVRIRCHTNAGSAVLEIERGQVIGGRQVIADSASVPVTVPFEAGSLLGLKVIRVYESETIECYADFTPLEGE